MADVTRYNLAQFVFDGTEIPVGSFKTTRKQSTETLSACNSHTPYAVMFGKEELTWEASDIDPIYRSFFEKVMDRQKANPSDLGVVSTYDYSELTGSYVEDDAFSKVWVEEIGKETANKPFTAKGSAMKKIKGSIRATDDVGVGL